MYAIATNLARDHYKRAETRYAVNESVVDSDVVPAISGVESVLIAADETTTVINSLMLLPEHQREAIVLRYYQELSLAEIAEALDIPVGTVKSRLSLGLKRLRELLEDES